MRAHKDTYANQCKEDMQLKSRIRDILLNKTKIGAITNEIFYLIQDEIQKVKKGIPQ